LFSAKPLVDAKHRSGASATGRYCDETLFAPGPLRPLRNPQRGRLEI